jgi:L-rhamnose-H+ transport protein
MCPIAGEEMELGDLLDHGGIFSWVVAPWVMASILVPDLGGMMAAVPARIAGLCVMFGMMWGFGGLTYGLTMRYLGLSLGMAVVLGLCTVFGTLIPPLVQGTLPPSCSTRCRGGLCCWVLG